MNHLGLNDFTPLDLAMHTQCPEVEHVLLDHGAKGRLELHAAAEKCRQFCAVNNKEYMYVAKTIYTE